MARGSLLFVIIAVVATRWVEARVSDGFTHMCYNRKPIVSHVIRSKAWNNGRRDILDWGCGGGALVLALARKGANRVVGIDLNPKNILAANKRLGPFPKAIARRSLFHGRIAYRNRFDFVISYMGALQDGSTNEPKLRSKNAMKYAVHACREGGHVIVADIHTFGNVMQLPLLAVLVFTRFLERSNLWLRHLVTFVACFLRPIQSVFLFLPTSNISRNVSRKKLSLVSVLCIGGHVWYFYASLKSIWISAARRKAEMKQAGLTDIKVRRRLCFRVTEAVGDDRFARKLVFRFNKLCSPVLVQLYEGGKKKKDGRIKWGVK